MNFIFILQIFKHFWLYRGSGHRTWNLCPLYKSTNIFGSTRGSRLQIWILFSFYKSTNIFGSTRGLEIDFIFILRFSQHFWRYKECGFRNWTLFSFNKSTKFLRLRNWNLISFCKSTNIFGSTRGLGLEIKFNFHSTNLPTFLALQGAGLRNWFFSSFYKSSNIFRSTRGLGLAIKFYFHSTNLPTFLALFGLNSTNVCLQDISFEGVEVNLLPPTAVLEVGQEIIVCDSNWLGLYIVLW